MVLGLTAVAHAQIVIDSARFGYNGTVARYNTLADALAGTDATAVGTVPQRDLGIYIVYNAPWYGTNCNYAGTAWNYISNTDGRTPSNTNYGFVQLGDLDASTITAIGASWSADLSTYTLSMTGANAPYALDYSRLWNVPATGGAAIDTGGTFLSYDLELVLGGLAATWNTTAGTYVSAGGDPASVDGTFSGLFQNTSAVGSGFYTFSLDLNMVSWAYNHRSDLTSSSDPYYASTVATGTIIPEPATYASLLGLAILGLAIWRRDKH